MIDPSWLPDPDEVDYLEPTVLTNHPLEEPVTDQPDDAFETLTESFTEIRTMPMLNIAVDFVQLLQDVGENRAMRLIADLKDLLGD